MPANSYKTWVELDKDAAKHNFESIKKLLKPSVKIWAVVKSNAYGHGLVDFSKIINNFGIHGFCVDSIPEAVKLRAAGIKKPILVLGPTLPGNHLSEAARHNIAITVSTFDALERLKRLKNPPKFHLKIDTGMHRQGFFVEDLYKVISLIGNWELEIGNCLKGIYTHFADSKNFRDQSFTNLQLKEFKRACSILEGAGFKNLEKHAAATSAALLNPATHLDAVRVGIGLYGLTPTAELRDHLSQKIKLQPVLSWHTLVSEIKTIPRGSCIGYDLTECVKRETKVAILPIGYWHGFSRTLSSRGHALINGKPAKVLGRVCMDLVMVDATGIACEVGETATLIGRQANQEISAFDFANLSSTSHYEVLTRINPLIKKISV